MNRFTRFIKHAFGISKSKYSEISKEEDELLLKLARGIVSRGLVTPAIMFLEPARPLNFLGSQVMTFFRPIITSIFPLGSYEKIEKLLEKRESIEWLITKIEEVEAEKSAK